MCRRWCRPTIRRHLRGRVIRRWWLNLRPVNRHFPHSTGLHNTWPLDTHFFHLVHQLDSKPVVSSETEQFVLVVGFVEENDVHRDAVALINSLHLGQNLRLVVSLVLETELQHAVLELFDLGFRGAEFDFQVDRIREVVRSPLVEDE